MPIPERASFASSDDRFRLLQTDDGSFTLEECETGNTFHSGCGAVSECLTVYAENSGVAERLRNGLATTVLEIGFGTGLSFLTTAALAIQSERSPSLRYVAIEQRLIPADVIRQVLSRSSETQPLNEPLVTMFLDRWTGLNLSRKDRADLELTTNGNLKLQLHITNVLSLLPGMAGENQAMFDAIYFDPFDPAGNAELWTAEVFESLLSMLRPGATLVSYCVKSDIRRLLVKTGFEVDRLPGPPGGKREVLIATRPAQSS